MKSIKRVIWLFLMIFLTMSLFSGCKEKQKTEEEKTENETTEDIIGEGVIRINDDGLAEWKSIEGAKKYNVDVVYWDGCPVLDYTKVITETSFQLEKGYSIQVAPVFEDGTMGEIMESEYYGGKQLPDKFAATLGLEYKSIAEEMIADFPEWEVVSNIDMSSVQKGSDGMTYFSATGPDGKPVRFCGIDTDVTEEGIILHKQANMGKTIIEKIEKYTDVGFGIVLYTPDDEGRLKGNAELSTRARQNVVFEHGYLIGKLGRDRVCALVVDNVEKPGDIDGIVYVNVDDNGYWKVALAKDMKAVGFNIDLNKAF